MSSGPYSSSRGVIIVTAGGPVIRFHKAKYAVQESDYDEEVTNKKG